MNKVKSVFVMSILMFCMIGCSTTGPFTARNGKTYYVNSDKCAKYRWWANDDKIECFDSDGNSHGYAYPMSQESLDAYYRQMEHYRKLGEEDNREFNRRMEESRRDSERNLRNTINCLGKPICVNVY